MIFLWKNISYALMKAILSEMDASFSKSAGRCTKLPFFKKTAANFIIV